MQNKKKCGKLSTHKKYRENSPFVKKKRKKKIDRLSKKKIVHMQKKKKLKILYV